MSSTLVGIYDGLFVPSSQLFLEANTRYFLVMLENTNNDILATMGSEIPVSPTGDGAT